MKRIIAVILLALVLTLAMAVPAMADSNTNVDLNINEPTIAVDAPNGISLGPVLRGTSTTLTGTNNGKVSCNAPLGYTVTMSRSSDRMQGSDPLQELFAAMAGDSAWVWTNAATTILDKGGPTSGAEDFTLDVSQQIVPTDPTGSYSITITFAGTVK